MQKQEILEAVIKSVMSISERPDMVTENTDVTKNLGFDELDILEYTLLIEKELDMEFTEFQVENHMKGKIKSTVDFIHELIGDDSDEA